MQPNGGWNPYGQQYPYGHGQGQGQGGGGQGGHQQHHHHHHSHGQHHPHGDTRGYSTTYTHGGYGYGHPGGYPPQPMANYGGGGGGYGYGHQVQSSYGHHHSHHAHHQAYQAPASATHSAHSTHDHRQAAAAAAARDERRRMEEAEAARRQREWQERQRYSERREDRPSSTFDSREDGRDGGFEDDRSKKVVTKEFDDDSAGEETQKPGGGGGGPTATGGGGAATEGGTGKKKKRKKRRKKKKKGGNQGNETKNDPSSSSQQKPPPSQKKDTPKPTPAKKEQPEPSKSAQKTGKKADKPEEKKSKEPNPPQKTKSPTKSKSANPAPQKTSKKADDEKKSENPPTTSKKSKKKGKKSSKKLKFDPHDPREHINLVFIGHVDAGKSTISGQILLKTGQIDERTIQKYEVAAAANGRDSWWIAYLMDVDKIEREKGKTVECGRANFETEKRRFTILDAPGHKSFVKNMICGASQADVAILVISARKGEFEAGFQRGGQTREHAVLALTLGIQRLIVAVNKMDVANDWSQKRYDTIVKDVGVYLKEIGWNPKNITYLPLSGQMGLNVKERLPKGTCPWYKQGPSLIGAFDNVRKIKRYTSRPLRATVLDRYKGDQGLTAIAKIESGNISIGDEILVAPSGQHGRIGHLSIDDTSVQHANAGENCLISFDSNKSKLNADHIHMGSVISATGDEAIFCTDKIRAEIFVCDLPESSIITKGFKPMLHVHNVATLCEVIDIPHKVHPKTRRRSKRPATILRNKDRAVVVLEICDGAIPVNTFKELAQLGRFALRDGDRTVVIGVIEDVFDGSASSED